MANSAYHFDLLISSGYPWFANIFDGADGIGININRL
jgi:hypothetical protein